MPIWANSMTRKIINLIMKREYRNFEIVEESNESVECEMEIDYKIIHVTDKVMS